MRMKKTIFLILLSLVSICMHADESKPVNLVFIGNSITYGAQLSDPATQAPPVKTATYVKNKTGRKVYYKNCGLSGSATPNWLPGTNLFGNADAAATTLQKNHPGTLVFSMMLGTNDTHEGYKTTPEKYFQNMRAIIEALMAKHPEARFIVNYPTWYSPNTHNGAVYLEAGLKRLQSYMPMITRLGEFYQKSACPRVWTGDSTVYRTFENKEEYFVAENGNSGVFYLHPNLTGGTVLSEFWGKSIMEVLDKAEDTGNEDALLIDQARKVEAACHTLDKSSVRVSTGLLKSGQISASMPAANGSSVDYLTDLNPATYYETDGTSEDVHGMPYLQVDLQRGDVSQIVFSITRRNAVGQDDGAAYMPNDVVVYGANAPDATQWTRLGGLHGFSPANNGSTYVSPLMLLGQAYRYLRFQVEGTAQVTLGAGGALMFNMGGFQVYAALEDTLASPYCQQEAVKQACDSLTAACDAAAASLASEGVLTEEQKTELRKGIERVSALHSGQGGTEENPNMIYVTGLDGTGLYSFDQTQGLLKSGTQLSSNSEEKNAGTSFSPSNLINPSTDYTSIIWHTAWLAASSPLPASTNVYLQTHLKESKSSICFTMIGSNWPSTFDTPDHMVVQASNTPKIPSSWKDVAELPNMIPAEEHNVHPAHYTSPCIDLGGTYSDLRFVVKETVNHRVNSNGGLLVNLARLQVYEPQLVVDHTVLLQAYVNQLASESDKIKGGTLPGCYDQEKVDEYFSLLYDAQLLCQMSPSSEEAQAMQAALKETYEAMLKTLRTLTDGFYRIQSMYGKFAEVQGESKALQAAFGDALEWNKTDEGNACQLFQLTKQEEGWLIQNVATRQYIGMPDDKTKRVAMTDEPATTFELVPMGDACFSIKPKEASASLIVENPADGASTAGYITVQAATEENLGIWQLTQLSDEATIQQLQAKALSLQTVDAAHKLYQEAMGCGTRALLTDGSQLYANSEMAGFPVSNLLSTSTSYNTIIFHTAWDASALPAGKLNYLQANLREPQSVVRFCMIGSGWSNTYDTPDDYVIMASDTPEDESSWQTITRLPDMIPAALHSTHPAFYDSPLIYLGKPYSNLRFVTLSTVNNRKNRYGNIYVSLARFQIYGNMQASESKYTTIEGLAEAVDEMDNLCSELQADLGSEDKTRQLQQQVSIVQDIMDGKGSGITPAPMQQKGEGCIYNLNGIKVDSASRGIYITGGKKRLAR